MSARTPSRSTSARRSRKTRRPSKRSSEPLVWDTTGDIVTARYLRCINFGNGEFWAGGQYGKLANTINGLQWSEAPNIFGNDTVLDIAFNDGNQRIFVFAQIMDRVPWRRFQTCVDRYRGDHNSQTFKCTDDFRVTAFAQLTYRESLRDIVACLNAVPEKTYHMGIRSGISRNNLSNGICHAGVCVRPATPSKPQ